jgi:N-carbamoyl-L-amino-acid hydrolase
MGESLTVNFGRLQGDVEALANIGLSADHGIYRMAFSPGDRAAREWLRGRIDAGGLSFYEDGAANLHARLGFDGTTASVMTGSHIDTVPGAGHLDGALGVLCGLECLRVFREREIGLRRPLELVAFSDEEGRFGGMLGSQAMTGALTPESLLAARDLEGVSLAQAMREQGLSVMDALRAARDPRSIHAFVELHIEQGPVLDREGITIGVVEGITGLRRWEVRLLGTANHAGTTPMDLRLDAFQGLAEFGNAIDRVLAEYGSGRSVATVGRVELVPGAANVVPGEARFSLEMRDTDARVLDELADAFRRVLSAIARRRDLRFEFEVVSTIEPVACDGAVLAAIEQAAAGLGLSSQRMPSGAAHDTQQIARIAPAGMIFVPSKQGRSHSPAEWTAWSDIEAGANVLLNTLYRLAR